MPAQQIDQSAMGVTRLTIPVQDLSHLICSLETVIRLINFIAEIAQQSGPPVRHITCTAG